MAMRSRECYWSGIGSALLLVGVATALAADKPGTITGRWDLTVQTPDGTYPSWLEVRRSGYTTLVGTFVGQVGSARPIGKVEFDSGTLRFTVPPQWERRKGDLHFDGKLEGDELRGETTDDKGRRVTWTGRRAPSLKRDHPPNWGEPVE